jgi:hypothetical protein
VINHARTLLLNKAGAQRPGTNYFLEEYVPGDYVPILLPGALPKSYGILVGNRADNAFANYRVWSLMRLVHATELAEYALALDPRITYLHEKDVTREYGTAFVAGNSISTGIAIYRVGTPVAERNGQRIYFRWLVTATGTDTVDILDLESPGELSTAVTGSDDLTDPITLPNQSGMKIRIGAFPLPVGGVWEVTTLVAPTDDITTLITAFDTAGADVYVEVFGAGTEEPYATCRAIWDKSAFAVHRLAAYALAHVYRVEAVRTHG